MNSNLALQSYPDIDMCQELTIMDKPKEWVSTKEAALLMDLDRDTVAEYCRRGTIECQKFGRDWMVNKQDAIEYKRSKRGRPRTE